MPGIEKIQNGKIYRIYHNYLSTKQEKNSVFLAIDNGPISIEDYIDRLAKYLHLKDWVFVVSAIYIRRYLEKTNDNFTLKNAYRIILVSTLLASKYFNDFSYSNKYWSKIGGISVQELNQLEISMLFTIDWKIHVDEEEYVNFEKKIDIPIV
jgi:hypothetical protein